jgi:uncharacterized protein YrrD
MLVRVDDLGPPLAYTALEEGTPVLDRSGAKVGVVEHVLADWQADIFEGVVVHTRPLPGRRIYADVEQIAEIRERGVLLAVDRDALREPPAEAGAREESSDGALEARLRHAWDWISGRR